MEEKQVPGFFGINHSNRDFTLSDSWGKNQFNNSFPAALVCYMGARQIDPVYLMLNDSLSIQHSKITVKELLGLPYNSDNLFFSFEEGFTPYSDLVIGQLARADLVMRDLSTKNKDCLAAFEIKLTALPDSSTFDYEDENAFGCEIVVRPATIVYIALAIARIYANERDHLKALTSPICSKIEGWEDAQNIRPHMTDIIEVLDNILKANLSKQSPLLLQPVWKTHGKKSMLAENCFDIFVWSNFGVTRLFVDQSKNKAGTFTRQERTVVWLIKMLDDFAQKGKVNPEQVTSQLTYNTRNDKAFAVSGKVTNPYMASNELTKPRIKKHAIRDIILGGGQNYLSPERRLDAIILNSPDLFEQGK